MDATESASASLGPLYAPEDPTLPKPWMGLIDGSTGNPYYWNPETNVTQYERPFSLPPPLPPGPPPSKTIPLQVEETAQPNETMTQLDQQTLPQLSQPLQQLQMQPLSHHNQLQPPGQQSHFHQLNQQFYYMQQEQNFSYQQPEHPPLLVQNGQQFSQQQLGQHASQPPDPQLERQHSAQHLPQQLMGQHLPQMRQCLPPHLSMQQFPYQVQHPFSYQQSGQQPTQQRSDISGQSLPYQQPGEQSSHQQPGHQLHHEKPGPQMAHQHLNQIPNQQFNYPQAHQMSFLQGLQSPGVQNLQKQDEQPGLQEMEGAGFQQVKHGPHSLMQVQQSGCITSNPESSDGTSKMQAHQTSGYAPKLELQNGGPPLSAQQSDPSLLHLHQGINSTQRDQINDLSRGAHQLGLMSVKNATSVNPSIGLKDCKEDQYRGPGNEVHFNNSEDIPIMGAHQPKFGPLPVIQNFQETRVAVANVQNIFPGIAGRFTMASSHPFPNVYSHAAANPPSSVPQRSSPRMIPSADIINFSAADLYRRQHEVTALGENVPAPFTSFESTGFPPEILREMHFAGFFSPTPVQAQTWPVALQGRDIVAIAKTGSGKTLGYLVPAFIHLRRFRNDPKIGPTVLVLAPTRELATQIQDEAIKFGRSSGISCICLYGGAPKGPQLREIEQGADIVVATPGRLNDILEMNKINFHQVSFLVLDEADRMLDMGFEPQIRKIVIEIPPRKQTLMYTATWPKNVRKIAGDLLFNPVQVNIGSIDELAANKAITQYVEVVLPMDKQKRLEQILRAQERGSKIIIFCSTKRLCDQLAHSIGRIFGVTAIHGDKSQNERDWALNQFRSGRSPILVATDVAARGLDIKDIRVVINYDFPSGIEDYVHRIGRTGRAGATGVAYTFFSDQDWKYASDLIKVLEGANQQVPLEVRQMVTRGGPAVPKDPAGLSQWDSDGGHRNLGSGRGMRGGMRDAGSGFGGRGGRGDFFRGRAVRGRGFGGPGGAGNHSRGARDRFGYMDGRGGRFGNRRPMVSSRDHSYSRSPERGRKWKWSRSRSRSRSRNQSHSRSWTRSRSYSRSRSQSRTRSHSFNSPPDRNHNRAPRVSGFDVLPSCGGETFPVQEMSPMSPGTSNRNSCPNYGAVEQTDQSLDPASATPSFSSRENNNGQLRG